MVEGGTEEEGGKTNVELLFGFDALIKIVELHRKQTFLGEAELQPNPRINELLKDQLHFLVNQCWKKVKQPLGGRVPASDQTNHICVLFVCLKCV